MSRPTIRPVVWHPPAAPSRTGPITVALRNMRVIAINGTGPEDVVVDTDGRIVTGVEDGRILRISPDGDRIERIADTAGRPLGIEWLPDGRLLVCDARKGLLGVDPGTGTVDVLADSVAGERILFCNNAAVAADGTVYFTDTSRRFGIDHYMADIIEHSGTGRLLRRDPDGRIEVVLDGLQFANGVALAPDESFVAVVEMGAYRLRRMWLTGERAGDTETLVDNLPGFPDNIATGSDGLIWIALVNPRNALLDRLHPLHPSLRRGVWALPSWLQPRPARSVAAMAVDGTGQVVHDVRGDSSALTMVTGVLERDGRLYLGSLTSRAVAVADVPTA